jgi:hypothetical protein
MGRRVRALAALLLGCWSSLAAGESPDPYAAVRANIVVTSVRLTDNGDNDGFADPHETVQVYVTLRNNSGADRQGIVVRMGSTDPTVACIPAPVASFGSLLEGEVREGTEPLVFRVANVVRSDTFQDLPISLDFAISGEDFGTTNKRQSVTLETDLNVSGGFLPTTYTEGFESGTFGSFTTQSLDIGRESLTTSDGHRCQYHDPDFVNSNSHGNTHCFLGAPSAAQNAYDWHVHGLASPDGGRAYLGNNSLHWGVHSGAASQDTARLRQLDAIRTSVPVNLGWNGVASELTFKHQVGLANTHYHSGPWGRSDDRGVVQVQLANSAGMAVGHWRKIYPYENVYDSQAVDYYTNCMFDPVDDGNDEDGYFDPSDPDRHLGPSSTCYPEFAFARHGAIAFDATFHPADIGDAGDGPGLQGSRGPGTWVETKFSLDRWRGRRMRLRFLASSFEISTALTWQQAVAWNPIEADDGWYIDDVRISNTLTGQATVTVDTADRSGLPACGPVCTSVTPSLIVTPEVAECGELFTLDASGSTADQCPDGALQYRFWWTWRGVPPGGVPHDYVVLLQDWNENGILTHPTQTIGAHPYRVDVRCSTRSACGGDTTGGSTVNASCPVVLYFPFTLRFESKSILSWGATTSCRHDTECSWVAGVRGSLGALRASGGNFAGTTEIDFSTIESSYDDQFSSVPAPGEGSYYLVRANRYNPPSRCALYSWMTGSPAEVPGAGGNRDQDLGRPPPPEGCP